MNPVKNPFTGGIIHFQQIPLQPIAFQATMSASLQAQGAELPDRCENTDLLLFNYILYLKFLLVFPKNLVRVNFSILADLGEKKDNSEYP